MPTFPSISASPPTVAAMSLNAFDVSVIVTTYNGSPWIVGSLTSVLEQSAVSVRSIIVVDDASTDDTCEKVLVLADRRIRLVRLESNGGVAAARNRGLAEANTQWIAFNDQDDVWLPDKLIKQVRLLEVHPDAEVVVGGEARLARDGRSRWTGGFWPMRWSPAHVPSLARSPIYDPSTDSGVYLQTMMVKTDLAKRVGGFKPTLPLADDTDFILRVCEAATRAVAVAEPVFLYRLGDHNQTAPGRVKAQTFLAARTYLEAAQQARRTGVPEPDPQTYIRGYVVNDLDIERFFLNQEIRLVNTLWVNCGLQAAFRRFITRTVFLPGVYAYVFRSLKRAIRGS